MMTAAPLSLARKIRRIASADFYFQVRKHTGQTNSS
jgi:hypothetical protein